VLTCGARWAPQVTPHISAWSDFDGRSVLAVGRSVSARVPDSYLSVQSFQRNLPSIMTDAPSNLQCAVFVQLLDSLVFNLNFKCIWFSWCWWNWTCHDWVLTIFLFTPLSASIPSNCDVTSCVGKGCYYSCIHFLKSVLLIWHSKQS